MQQLLAVEFPCPKIKEEDENVKNSEIVNTFNQKYKDIYEYTSLHTGGEIKDALRAGLLYLNLKIEVNI